MGSIIYRSARLRQPVVQPIAQLKQKLRSKRAAAKLSTAAAAPPPEVRRRRGQEGTARLLWRT